MWQSGLTILMVAATVVMAVATWRMARRVGVQTEAINWQNREMLYQQLLQDIEAEPGTARRLSATWGLITIAEEWGTSRQRGDIQRLFAYMAAEEDKIKAKLGDDDRWFIGVKPVLEAWGRHGWASNPAEEYEGAEIRIGREGLWKEMWKTYLRWQHKRKWRKNEIIQTRPIGWRIETAQKVADGIDRKLRGTGAGVRSTSGKVSLYKQEGKSEHWVSLGNRTWDEVMKQKDLSKLVGVRWETRIVIIDPSEDGGMIRGQYSIQGVFDARNREGKWQVSSEVWGEEEGGKNARIWQRRRDGARWVESGKEAWDEMKKAGEALATTLARILHEKRTV